MKHTKKRQINFGNEQKICTHCSVPLEIKKVGPSKGNCYISNYNNRIYKCNKCFYEYTLSKVKKWRKNKTVGSSQHIADMIESARQRAKKYNIPYTLKSQDIRDIITDRCPILGIKFELNKQKQKWGKGKNQNNWQTSPSLDRIVPAKGYTKDNVLLYRLWQIQLRTKQHQIKYKRLQHFIKSCIMKEE